MVQGMYCACMGPHLDVQAAHHEAAREVRLGLGGLDDGVGLVEGVGVLVPEHAEVRGAPPHRRDDDAAELLARVGVGAEASPDRV